MTFERYAGHASDVGLPTGHRFVVHSFRTKVGYTAGRSIDTYEDAPRVPPPSQGPSQGPSPGPSPGWANCNFRPSREDCSRKNHARRAQPRCCTH